MLQIASSGFLERRSSMNLRRAMNVVIAIIAIMAMVTTTVYAATVQSAVEVTSNKTEEKVKKYPKSLQMKLLESKNDTEVARAMEVAKPLKENTAKVDSFGVAWKSAAQEDIAKVRVKAGNIDFQWTPIFVGYTWMSDLSMWSNRSLLGKEATLYFLDKNDTVLWSTTVVLPKELKVPEVDTTAKEEIVPPCPNMAPTASAKESVEIGIAPGSNKK